ncbi:MAG TPA: UbiD family decarboxylase [Stellaceae bacterium]|nr:UbiD family decarboxylase [Stellaceae bacterium]
MPLDTEKFRLRRFVERLATLGEVETHDASVSLGDLATLIERSAKVTHFRSVGPEGFEMVAGVNASRKRLAAAFGVDEAQLRADYLRRLHQPQTVAEIASADAPVHQIVLTGDQLDLTRLPFYLQHEFDGAPYISAAMDFAVDPATAKPNVGCRRLMLKSRQTLRSNLTQPSDLRRIYLGCVARKERLPVSFVIGAHPCDFLAATSKAPLDEFELVARIRGETLPMVRGVTNGIPVPADAELVIEGYFDEAGYSEIEGPYGELYGLYGPMHPDPIFHATAVTSRRDVLHQTLLHGGKHLTRNDAAQLSALNFEIMVWHALKAAELDVVAVYLPPAATGLHHARIAIRQSAPGQSRAAIAAAMKLPLVKHVFVVDEDIDIHSQEAMEWAFATRFRADRDVIAEPGHFALSMDPTGENGKMVKAGFDLTRPFGAPDIIENRLSRTPHLKLRPRFQTVQQALETGPKYFIELMEALGTEDGRALVVELDRLQREGMLGRGDSGEWVLQSRTAR